MPRIAQIVGVDHFETIVRFQIRQRNLVQIVGVAQLKTIVSEAVRRRIAHLLVQDYVHSVRFLDRELFEVDPVPELNASRV